MGKQTAQAKEDYLECFSGREEIRRAQRKTLRGRRKLKAKSTDI